MGLLRFALASLVVLHHLAKFPFVGHHAVLFFFVISGYLMTFVMQKSYGYHSNGLLKFWTNRVLRLFPAYWAVLTVSVVVLSLIPVDAVQRFHPVLGLPNDVAGWLQNVSMLYFSLYPGHVEPRISPATWALTTELFWYALISLGLSRTRIVTWIWFLASLCYTCYCFATDLPELGLYYSVLAGSLPFACGALIFHYREAILHRVSGRERSVFACAAIFFAALLAVRVAVRVLTPSLEPLFDGLALALTCIPAVMAVCSLCGRPWSFVPIRHDKLLGDLSYPLYISHWIAGLVVAYALGLEERVLGPEGAALFLSGVLISTAISWCLVKCIDVPVQSIRKLIRPSSSS